MSSTTLICTLTLAIGIGLGVGLDRTLSDGDSTGKAASAGGEHRSSPATAADSAPPPGIAGTESFRAVLREELSSALSRAMSARPPAAGTAVAMTAPAPLATPTQRQEAKAAANDLIAGGQWGDEERSQFHQKMAMLSPAEVEQEMQRLVQAIDSGSVKLSTDGPML